MGNFWEKMWTKNDDNEGDLSGISTEENDVSGEKDVNMDTLLSEMNLLNYKMDLLNLKLEIQDSKLKDISSLLEQCVTKLSNNENDGPAVKKYYSYSD